MKNVKKFFVLILLFVISISFYGCWDNVELDEIFIVAAMAIDITDNPEEFELTIEVAKTGNQTSTTSSRGGSESGNTIIMKEKGKSMMDVLKMLDFDSSRNIILQHNQVLLIGKEIAETNITRFMDFFLRDRQARLEVIMVLVDGKAGDILSVDPEQESTSSAYVVGMVKDITKVAGLHKLRILDFVNDLVSPSKSSAMPIISKIKVEDKEEIKLKGMGYFKDGKLIAIQDEEESLGIFFANGEIKGQVGTLKSDEGTISYYVEEIKTVKKLQVKDGKLTIDYKIYPVVSIGEIIGFGDYDFLDFIKVATKKIEENIKHDTEESIAFLQSINVDALDFSVDIYKKQFKTWRKIKDNWDYIFKNAKVNVEVKATIPASGKSAESVLMEQARNDDR